MTCSIIPTTPTLPLHVADLTVEQAFEAGRIGANFDPDGYCTDDVDALLILAYA